MCLNEFVLCFLAEVFGSIAVSKRLGEYELKRSRLVISLLVHVRVVADPLIFHG